MDERDSAKHEEAIAVEAIKWLEQETHTDPMEGEKFERWLTKSPAHVKALLLALGWKRTLPKDLANCRTDPDELLSDSTNVIHVPGPAAPATRMQASRWPRRIFLALGTVAAAAIALAVMPFVRDNWSPNVYVTAIGEQRTIGLPDGSTVAMNTKSKLRVSFSDQERAIYLSNGQALFSVAHDKARPFRVHVDGGAVVQAVGTKFDVRRLDDRTSVAVIEGVVQVAPAKDSHSEGEALREAAQRTRLAAGEGVSILDHGEITPPAPIDFAKVNAWQQRRLMFVDDRLSDIVDEFQRYSRVRIRIDGTELAERRYSGVWDADRPEVLLTYLRAYGGVRVDREGEGFAIRAIDETSAAN